MTLVRFPTAAEGIARELELLAAGQPATLIWQAGAPALVMPETWARRAGVAAVTAALAAAGWPVLTRPSGGGGVPQGPGTLNIAVVVPLAPGFRIEDGYDLICGVLTEALGRLAIAAGTGAVDGAFCDGAWNITVEGRKLAGTAQRWRGGTTAGAALLHAAVQVAPPPETAWPALDTLYRAAGLIHGLRPDAHVTLAGLLSDSGQRAAFPAALARAANDRLSRARRAA